MRHNTVYRTVNLVNGHEYTGKHETDDLDDGYLGSGKLIRRAIEKHGRENLRKEILHDFETSVEMNAAEAGIVTEAYCARKDTYNLCPGGDGGWGYINGNEELRVAKNQKAARISNPKRRGKKKPHVSKELKRRHEEGLCKKMYFGSRDDDAEIQAKAWSPEAREKRRITRRATMIARGYWKE
jgi:hypothetical protein